LLQRSGWRVSERAWPGSRHRISTGRPLYWRHAARIAAQGAWL